MADDTDPAPSRGESQALFRRTIVQVIGVQVITLLLLGLLQYMFTPRS